MRRDRKRRKADLQAQQALRIVGQHEVDACVLQRMAHLRGGEIRRQRDVQRPGAVQREIGDRPAAAVVGEQRMARALGRQPREPATLGVDQMFGLVHRQTALAVVQCEAPCTGVRHRANGRPPASRPAITRGAVS